jgi:hypothetical protein
MSLLLSELERILVSVLVDRLRVVVLYSDPQDHEQSETRLQVSDEVEVRVPYRESSVGRQRCYRSIQISQFNPSAMDMKYDWEVQRCFYSRPAAPCGFHDHFRNADRGDDGHWSACADCMHGRLEKCESSAGIERAATGSGGPV